MQHPIRAVPRTSDHTQTHTHTVFCTAGVQHFILEKIIPNRADPRTSDNTRSQTHTVFCTLGMQYFKLEKIIPIRAVCQGALREEESYSNPHSCSRGALREEESHSNPHSNWVLHSVTKRINIHPCTYGGEYYYIAGV